ncbi:dynein light chain [Plasmopara halstedii]|uniref:Dynein light chain n=1 Tax=Plasmopara halstedii TaxID=4781 RepID=A0A0P1AZS3_PLAHL|nr:dynein light chain [Plasmopara halstedii]CEG46865.1 dynein light chain [Plasmopara halstedii]|eukprot:XP_024583234.1 dynein light chain [Plasmopara halstedii]
MWPPSAASSDRLETRERMAQLQLKATSRNVIAAGRVARSSYCDHSGWGYKQGSIIKSWKRRFFVLKGRELIYFEERSPSGKGIDEKGRLRISGVEYTPEFTNALLVRGELKNQAVKMQVESNEEIDEWFVKISEALHAATEALAANQRKTTGSGDVAMKGWLMKEGQNFKTWKRRYMTLTGNIIQYRAQISERPLGETKVNAVNINPSRPFALDIYSDNNRILRIAADSFAEIEAWDHAFAKAIGKRPCFGDPYAGQNAPFLGETFEESVLCEGWLYKRGQRSTEWQRRYFILKGYQLQYQDGPGESIHKGAGTVVGLTLGEACSNSIFVQLSSSRVLCVSADSQISIDKWIQTICTLLGKDPNSLEKEASVASNTAIKCTSGGNILTRAFSRALSNASAPPMLGTSTSQSELEVAQSSLSSNGGYLEECDDGRETDDNLHLRESVASERNSLEEGNKSTGDDYESFMSGSVRKCGWLRKEGARNRSLKRRYFMADDNKLYYFEQIGEAPRGNGIVKSIVPNDTYPNCLDLILKSGRTLRVVAESPDEIRSWLDHFNECIPRSDGPTDRRSVMDIHSLVEDPALKVMETGSGWLLKKGKNFRTWKRRFFKLNGKQFSYASAPTAPPLGCGVVENVMIGNARPFCLDVRFQNGRVMQLVASNETEMVAWNRLLQAAVLSEPIESDLEQDAQFDFDDAEEDAQLGTMHSVVTATRAFKRGITKASSSLSTVSSCDSLIQEEKPTIMSAQDSVTKTNERAEAAAKAVAAAMERQSARLVAMEAEEPVVCSGWLRKEGGTVKNWKRRYFTLHGATLCYFKSDNGALLRSFTVCHVVTLRTKRLCLEITTEVGRKLLVASETQADLDRWLDHLHRAIAAEKQKKQNTDSSQWTNELRCWEATGLSRRSA